MNEQLTNKQEDFYDYLRRVAPELIPAARLNDAIYKNAPRVIRDYINDDVYIVCGRAK